MYDVAIVGGGLAGLISGILLKRAGLDVALFEKKQYPFHRVCGEYISNEVIPFLEKHDLFPTELGPSHIDQLIISSSSGLSFSTPLDLGGFGISRYRYDYWLAKKLKDCGAKLFEGTTIRDIQYQNSHFTLTASDEQTYQSKLVIGAHGKRTKLDQTLDRKFISKHSPFVGVKNHIKTDFPSDTIALHNFNGGYCGISRIEDETYNMCYLIHRDQIKKHGSIEATEHNILSKNPHLKQLMRSSDYLFDRPEVINEVSFKPKEAVYGNILMTGDAAGTITPLSGNGMSIAIRSAYLLCTEITKHTSPESNLEGIKQAYQQVWDRHFKQRMWVGRKIQSLYFGHPLASHLAVLTGIISRPLARTVIRQTHGEPFS